MIRKRLGSLVPLLRSIAGLVVVGGVVAISWSFARDMNWYQELTGTASTEQVPSDLTEVFKTAVVTRADVADVGEIDARLVYEDEVLFVHRIDPVIVTTTSTVGQGRNSQTLSTTAAEPDSRAITDLPEPGTIVEDGSVLYETDSTPVYVVSGSVAAWRTMDSSSNGDDVVQLQKYLLEGGWADDALVADGLWSSATTAAVELWQTSTGQPVSGVIPLGDLWFIESPIRIVENFVTVGMVVADGDEVLRYTSEGRVIIASVPELPDGLLTAEDITARLPNRSIVDVQLMSTRGSDTGFDLTFAVDLDDQIVGSLDRLSVTLLWTVNELVGELTIPPEAIQRLDSGAYVVSVLDGDLIQRTEVQVIGQAGRVVAIDGLDERTQVIIP
ncbi:MAG: peptidoglycan hydrolase-like protein with peptidoglycan-binding domain [Verrucomicrobiales bacterium]|jgi:peptidoglycan hydrolase-like protein with peptidoglycan-binding domain